MDCLLWIDFLSIQNWISSRTGISVEVEELITSSDFILFSEAWFVAFLKNCQVFLRPMCSVCTRWKPWLLWCTHLLFYLFISYIHIVFVSVLNFKIAIKTLSPNHKIKEIFPINFPLQSEAFEHILDFIGNIIYIVWRAISWLFDISAGTYLGTVKWRPLKRGNFGALIITIILLIQIFYF